AVAVLAVVAYHAGLPLPGGFAGVDVFFVISGYLIARLLRAEAAETGRIDLPAFWERRARRLLPALFAVLAATMAAAWVLLLPRELEETSFALRGASIFAANLALADLLDYFAGPSERQALLHLWSLGVEEQFYLAFPLLAAALMRRAWSLRVFAGLAAASFAAAQVGVATAPENAFFLPHMRAWELLVGVLLAWAGPLRPSGRVRAAAGLAGAALLALTFALAPGAGGYPGWPAALPVAGAALLIAAGDGGAHPVGRVLSLGPVAAAGLISYSLYLWHWPLLALPRAWLGGDLPGWGAALAVAAA
ncbi:MAG: acyltransferase, partial [Pseudomonadota bacterium]